MMVQKIAKIISAKDNIVHFNFRVSKFDLFWLNSVKNTWKM